MIKKWTLICVWLVSLMIIVGGMTRITDSGLSITEFELLDGVVPPFTKKAWEKKFNKYKKTSEFKLINYNMSIKEFKVIYWWEYFHRLLGRVIGLFFLVPVLFKKLFFKRFPHLYKRYVVLFFMTVFQGIVGWYMVSSGLKEGMVNVAHFRLSMHLSLAVILFCYLIWTLFLIYNHDNSIKGYKKLYSLLLLFIPFVFLQIIFGAFVSGTGAGNLYHTFPSMNGQFIPDSLFAAYSKKGFVSLFNNLASIQFIHRILGIIIFIYTVFLFFYSNFRLCDYMIKSSLYIILLAVICQFLFGVFVLVFEMSIYFRIFHHIGFLFFVFAFVRLLFYAKKKNPN